MGAARPLVVISQPIAPSAVARLKTMADVEAGQDSGRIMPRAELLERLFLRRLRRQVLSHILMTMGFALIFQDLALLIWGSNPYAITVPATLWGSLRRRTVEDAI